MRTQAETSSIGTTRTAEAIFFANGTTALYCALRALNCTDKYVGMPAAVCPSVVAAVLASGNTPYFIDIERERLGLCPKSLQLAAGKLGAVIAVHAYGIPCGIVEIQDVCARLGIPLIEDCAQAQGASSGGADVGSWGDISIFSYGAGKIVEAGGGGKAVSRNPALIQSLKYHAGRLPGEDATASGDLSTLYKFFYNKYYPDRLEPFRFIFKRLFKDFGIRMIGRFDPAHAERIQKREAQLEQNIAERLRKADVYKGLLGHRREVTVLPLPAGSTPWRFNIWLEKQHRDKILRSLIADGVSVSSWYPSITPYLEPEEYLSTALPNCNWLGEGVLNLWIDESTSNTDIQDVCTRICDILDARQ